MSWLEVPTYIATRIRRRAALAVGVTIVGEESVEEYTDRVIPAWWKNPEVIPSWWNSPEPPLDPVLVERFAYYFRRGLELLDAGSRDDPFWDKSNRKATVFKAVIWFRQVLDAHPGDTEARWILAALNMTSYTPGGVIALLAPLVAESPSILRWLVDVTVYIWLSSGLIKRRPCAAS